MTHAPVADVVEYELLFDCVHCGLCLEACPTYVLTRAEMDSPRGRIYLMKSLAEGQLELDDDVTRHLDLCLGCRGCETACPSGVHYGRLIERARAYVESHARRGWRDRFIRFAIGKLFPYPWRLRIALAPLRLAERFGWRERITRLFPSALREWIELLPPLNAVEPAVLETNASDKGPSVAVHRGCVVQVVANSANVNSEALLSEAGYRTVSLRRTICCGALDLHGGNRDRALRFARANVREFRESGASTIVSAASGCAAMIAEYTELLKGDAELSAAAREVSAKVSDLSTLLLAAPPKAHREFRCSVTYHDSCHLAHGLGIREAPRRLLTSITGVRLIEMAESDLCCGSAGSYNLTEPSMARALANRKVDRIEATGADFVVMGNPGCQFQIAAELKRRGSKTQAIHIADFVAMARGAG